jgi:hypothetical protein
MLPFFLFSLIPAIAELIGGPDIRFLEFKELLFFRQAAGKAAQTAVFPHYPVAGNDDGEGIPAGGRPGGTDGLGRACPFGQFAVADCFSAGDERDLPPDFFLEIRAGQVQRKRETYSFSREIFLELLRRLLKNRVPGIGRPMLARDRNMIAAGKIKAGEGGVVGDQHEVVHRAFDHGIIFHAVFPAFHGCFPGCFSGGFHIRFLSRSSFTS